LDPRGPKPAPTFLQRCEWAGPVMARGSTPENMIKQLIRRQQDGDDLSIIESPWTLNYLCLSELPAFERRNRSYSSSTLLCAVSQAIQSPPAALDPSSSENDRLVLVDSTNKAGEKAFYLVKREEFRPITTTSTSFQKKWSRRPFEYSSAINPDIAELVLDILEHLVKGTNVRFLDPCCGSGTFLAAALEREMHVTGYDANEKCVKGTKDNLLHMVGGNGTDRLDLQIHDSSVPHPTNPKFDCVACNLPWNLNTKISSDENIRILTTSRRYLEPGAPCAVISKEREDAPFITDDSLRPLGFSVIGRAQVPQKNFTVPRGNKKPKEHNSLPEDKGRSHCLVTIVKAV